jgi:hypothetical protein
MQPLHFFFVLYRQTKAWNYLIIASNFDSKYKGGDCIRRNTQLDKGFVVTLIVGKEFFQKNRNVLGGISKYSSNKITFDYLQ